MKMKLNPDSLEHPDAPRHGDPQAGELPTYGDPAVLRRMAELSDELAWYRDRNVDIPKRLQQELDVFRKNYVGLFTSDKELLERYWGFHEDGKARASELAHRYGIREVDVHQCIRNLSLRIARG